MADFRIDGKNVYLGSKMIAQIDEEVCIIERSKDKHFYRVLDSWCLNYDLLKELVERNVARIQIVDKKNAKIYEVDLSKVRELTKRFNTFLSFGSEKQVAVPLPLWDVFRVANGMDSLESLGKTVDAYASSTFTGRWAERLRKHGDRSQQDIFGGLDG